MYFYCLDKFRESHNIETTLTTSSPTDKFHKTAFSTLKLKTDKTYLEFTFENKSVQVLRYLPVQEKEDIIEVAYQKAIINSNFNPILFNIYFLLNVVYSYTNLTFTDEQRRDEKKLYDMICSSGLLDIILNNIPESEMMFFEDNIEDYVSQSLVQDYSAVGIFNNVVGSFNTFSKVISDKLSNVDEKTLQTLIDALPNLVNGKQD